MPGRSAVEAAVEPDSMPSFEQWLQQAGSTHDLPVQTVAAAMADDGVDGDEARLLAAAAVLRYGGGSLGSLLDDSRLDEAALVFARYLHSVRHASTLTDAVISSRFRAGTIKLADGQVVNVRLRARSPEIALLDDVLTSAECEAMIEAARAGLTDSQILGLDKTLVDATIRSSSGAFVDISHGACVRAVEARCAELLGWPLECCESLEVTRYLPGQYFGPHVDYFETGGYAAHDNARDAGGQRIGTLILYLTDVPAGGATSFEYAGLEFQPKRGSALYFGYALADGKMDLASLHQGMPVEQGEKWIATLWLRERRAR